MNYRWSLGASLLEDERLKFSDAIRKLSEFLSINNSADINMGQLPGNEKVLHNYHFDLKIMQWVSWTQFVPVYQHNRQLPFHQILVPILDTVRRSWYDLSFNFTFQVTSTISYEQKTRFVCWRSWNFKICHSFKLFKRLARR